MSQTEPQHGQTPQIQLRAIFVTGPDAIAFLQSQLTIDFDAIADSDLHPAAWCSPDGRVDTVMLLARRGEDAVLVVPEPILAATDKRIRMYMIGRNVEILQSCPVHPVEDATDDGATRLKLGYDSTRAVVIEQARADAALPAEWLRADIEQRMPWILPATSKAFLPQMLGLEALGGLSYAKGCFPGQEVIARVHYRGRVTRRTVAFRLQGDAAPEPGAEFEVAGKPATVLYALAEDQADDAIIGLAVVPADAADGAAIMIGGTPGTLVDE